MTKMKQWFPTFLWVLIGLILTFDVFRGAMRDGDFIGYINAGNAVLDGKNIYRDYLNTWPPFFSVFSVLFAIGDRLSSFLTKFIWLLGSVFSMYATVVISAKLFFKKSFSFRKIAGSISFQDTLILVPLLIVLRFILDNLANVQINMYMLLCSVLAIQFFIQKKYAWVGFLLAFTISVKIYTIFFLFYFLFKREFKPVAWTFLFLLLINVIPMLVFGISEAIHYYQHWATEVAPKSFVAQHKNQSLFGAFLRFLTAEKIGFDLQVNFLSLDPRMVKKMTYAAIAAAAIIPAYMFRHKLKAVDSLSSLLQYSLIFTLIPLLSPVSWKPYFVFLWIPYLLLFLLLYRMDSPYSIGTQKVLKGLFWLSVLLNIGSTELIVGNYFSDVLEAYSAITIGTLILLFVQLYITQKIDSFDLQTIRFRTTEESIKV